MAEETRHLLKFCNFFPGSKLTLRSLIHADMSKATKQNLKIGEIIKTCDRFLLWAPIWNPRNHRHASIPKVSQTPGQESKDALFWTTCRALKKENTDDLVSSSRFWISKVGARGVPQQFWQNRLGELLTPSVGKVRPSHVLDSILTLYLHNKQPSQGILFLFWAQTLPTVVYLCPMLYTYVYLCPNAIRATKNSAL